MFRGSLHFQSVGSSERVTTDRRRDRSERITAKNNRKLREKHFTSTRARERQNGGLVVSKEGITRQFEQTSLGCSDRCGTNILIDVE